MKKILLFAAVVISVMTFTGCYSNSSGFPAVLPAAIFSETTRGTFMLPKLANFDGVEVLGEAEGRASMENVLFIVATGDASINAAKKDALRIYKDADDIVNVEVDAYHKSILGLFNTSTTILRGYAVKYKRNNKK